MCVSIESEKKQEQVKKFKKKGGEEGGGGGGDEVREGEERSSNNKIIKNGWQNKLRNRSTCPKLRKNVSIPEVILQSAFSRTVISLSKHKRMNAHGHNSATSYFDDVTRGSFYS